MKISIVIIEYHCAEDVAACLQSVNKYLAGVERECIVLSNSEYTDAELLSVKSETHDALLVRAPKNLGYAGGVNAALKHATGDLIYILNPDCLLMDSNIVEIAKEMLKDPQWAIAGPKVIDVKGEVQPSCRRFPRPWTFLLVRSALSRFSFSRAEKERYLMHDFDHRVRSPVDWVSGGAMLVRSDCIEKIGGMDERYFLYMEDVDWCHTAWNNGYKVVYSPESTVLHSGQHRSIRVGLGSLLSKHLRLHMSSMFKYFLKYGISLPARGVS